MPYFEPRKCSSAHWLDYSTVNGRKAVCCRYCDYYEYID